MGIIATKIKKIGEKCCRNKKKPYFCAAIGLWCNGNTTDSGPVIHGSSPCNPTERLSVLTAFFLCLSVVVGVIRVIRVIRAIGELRIEN